MCVCVCVCVCTQATEADDDLKASGSFLPALAKSLTTGQPLHTHSHTPLSPSSTCGSGGGAGAGDSGPLSPQRALVSRGTNQPNQGVGALTPTAANRRQRLSPNGAILNSSVDTVLASSVRPKVRVTTG